MTDDSQNLKRPEQPDFGAVLVVEADELCELVDMLLWGFSNPSNWLADSDVYKIINLLALKEPSESVREAIAECQNYLDEGFGRVGHTS